jgi:hypothetical protein
MHLQECTAKKKQFHLIFNCLKMIKEHPTRQIFLLLLTFLLAFSAFSQEEKPLFKIGPEYDLDDYFIHEIFNHDEENLFAFGIDMNNKNNISSIAMNLISRNTNAVIEVEDWPISENIDAEYFDHLLITNENNSGVLFLAINNEKTDKYELLERKFNNRGEWGEQRKMIEFSRNEWEDSVFLKLSPDKSHLLLLGTEEPKGLIGNTENKNAISSIVVDMQGNVKLKIKKRLPVSPSELSIMKYEVSNTGMLYLLTEVKSGWPYEKPETYTLFTFNGLRGRMTKTPIDFKDNTITDSRMSIDPKNGVARIIGFYSTEKGAVYTKEGGTIIKRRTEGIFDLKVNPKKRAKTEPILIDLEELGLLGALQKDYSEYLKDSDWEVNRFFDFYINDLIVESDSSITIISEDEWSDPILVLNYSKGSAEIVVFEFKLQNYFPIVSPFKNPFYHLRNDHEGTSPLIGTQSFQYVRRDGDYFFLFNEDDDYIRLKETGERDKKIAESHIGIRKRGIVVLATVPKNGEKSYINLGETIIDRFWFHTGFSYYTEDGTFYTFDLSHGMYSYSKIRIRSVKF